MSKRDDLLRAGGANVLESMGGGPAKPAGLPAGMEGVGAMRKPAHLEGTSKERGALRIATGRIVRDEGQPRTEFDADELSRLADSLRTRGQLQPVRVRWDSGLQTYVLISGERRWRAAQMAGLAELSCIVHEGTPDAGELLALQLVENALRADLTAIEQGKAYRRLIDAQGWSARQLAAELSVAPSTITRALALLDLPEAVQEQVEHGALAAASAYEVSRVQGAALQSEVAEAVVRGGLRGSEVGELVQAIRAKRPAPESRREPITLDVGGCSVTIRWKRGDTTTLVQALRKATRLAQEQEREEQAA